MGSTATPRFADLDRADCQAVLARNHVGRVAYARHNHIDIEPVHYVYSDGWIYGRTSPGRKLEMTGYSWWPVAFEVDEVTNLFHWDSVVVHGGFYAIPPRGTQPEVAAWKRGVELLRQLIPESFSAADPVAFRHVLFRIAVQEVRGRSARPALEIATQP